MVLYGVALLPLAQHLHTAVPHALQPWYADDCAIVGTAPEIRRAMGLLEELGPAGGYFPEPAKSLLVAREAQLPELSRALQGLNFQYRMGAQYLGSFIGNPASCQA